MAKKTTNITKNDNQAGAGSGSEVKTVASALQKNGEAVLKLNPELGKVYVTTDGSVFASECDAKNHGKTLANPDVLPVGKSKDNE